MATQLMPHSYLDQLTQQGQISSTSSNVLEASGARTPEAILSLLQAFPTLAIQGLVDSPMLSNTILKTGSSVATQSVLAAASAGNALQNMRRAANAPGYGAQTPVTALWKPNQIVPIPKPMPSTAVKVGGITLNGIAPTDVFGCPPWPVRDQGARGTCVAFATAALREMLMCEQSATQQDTSEQFLYWDIKTHSADPWKNSDGTLIEYAFESLDHAGICLEPTWPYSPIFNPTNIAHGGPNAPPPTAGAQAMTLRWKAALYRTVNSISGNAQLVLDALIKHQRPVAISLPVFSDPAFAQVDNWTTQAGWLWGQVLDPPPTSTAIGGHCVCVTGFEPDLTEPLGGYFIIRNSWSTQWGSLLPQPGSHGPEAGYGQVSASYVDRFLWECGQL